MNNSQQLYPIIVGHLEQKVIDLLGLSLPAGHPIMLGPSNIEHMRREHPDDFVKYFHQLRYILASPDYVSFHPNDGSIQYIKILDAHVLVAVRVTGQGNLYARTLFTMSDKKIEKYKKGNFMKPYY